MGLFLVVTLLAEALQGKYLVAAACRREVEGKNHRLETWCSWRSWVHTAHWPATEKHVYWEKERADTAKMLPQNRS